jgi:hypothetical protein
VDVAKETPDPTGLCVIIRIIHLLVIYKFAIIALLHRYHTHNN